LSWIITWLTIGAIFTLVVGGIAKWTSDPADMLTNKERVVVILGWPLYLVVFVYSFIKSMITGGK